MRDVVIRAENLGKKYVIGHQAENGRYVALRDVLMHNACKMWQTTKSLVRGEAVVQGDSIEEIWALRVTPNSPAGKTSFSMAPFSE